MTLPLPSWSARETLWLLGGTLLAVTLWAFLLGLGRPLAQASALGFGVVLASALPLWARAARRGGWAAALLSALLVVQGLHLLEHVAQLAQYYLLGWPAGRALGLIAAFNVEWVHFGWNWLVWAGLIALAWRGLRGPWAYVLLAWATLHALEHGYLLARHLALLRNLDALGLPSYAAAQALPGILGRDGWLAGVCGALPGLGTAPRPLVHFWWNAGELGLLLLAAAGGAVRRTPDRKERP